MLEQRAARANLRRLLPPTGLVDFASNDYLGFAGSGDRGTPSAGIPGLHESHKAARGSTGSRLISGNHALYESTEQEVARFHGVPAALIYTSGYDANLGLLSAVPQRTDVVFYDEAVHASLRDGIRLSHARAYSFTHNNLEALEKRAETVLSGRSPGTEVYVVTESVFSMEGDGPPLKELLALCHSKGFRLILDEAHAVGVLGPQGRGRLQGDCPGEAIFARIVTFGKALGGHGAAMLGSAELRDFLVNFSRSLIYTTALPPLSLKHLAESYQRLQGPEGQEALKAVRGNIRLFQETARHHGLGELLPPALAAIRCCRIGDSQRALEISRALATAGFDVRAMRPPTVPEGSECLRFCLHSFNTSAEIQGVLSTLASVLKAKRHA